MCTKLYKLTLMEFTMNIESVIQMVILKCYIIIRKHRLLKVAFNNHISNSFYNFMLCRLANALNTDKTNFSVLYIYCERVTNKPWPI